MTRAFTAPPSKSFVPDENGNIKAVVTVELKPEKDEKTGRTVMTEIPGSEKTLDCSLLLIAAGFLGPKPYIAKKFRSRDRRAQQYCNRRRLLQNKR